MAPCSVWSPCAGFLVATGGAVVYWLERYGLWGFALTFIICMAYPLELALQKTIWWDLNHTVMAAFGFVAGVGLGAYIMPVFHGDDRLSP